MVNLSPLPRIFLHGVWLHSITEQRCIEHILSELAHGRGGAVVTPNVDHLRRCQRDLSFAALVSEAELVVADGMPLVWASRLQGTPLPQRVAGSDLISSLSAGAASQGRSVFLLGGDPGTAEAAATMLLDRCPQLRIAGTYCPRQNFERDSIQLQEITKILRAANPDIVYVALGSPKQERLIDRIRDGLPRAWWLGVGVSFSFLCGDVRRAPPWMRRWGLEWMHRLAQEPKRLFRRYVVVGLPFAAVLLMRATARAVPNRLFGPFSKWRKFEPRTHRSREFDLSNEADSVHSNGQHNGNGLAMEKHEGSSAPMIISLPSSPTLLNRLRGLVLLGGSVRVSPLASVIGRSVLDLPIGNGGTVLTRWLDQAEYAAKRLGMEQLPVRLLLDQVAPQPTSAAANRYRLERDSSQYSGTGGLLANAALDYADDDLMLVGNATQLLLNSLTGVLTALAKTGGAVSLVGHVDGTPSGLMLLSCRALRLIPSVGFVDMKEQALPTIAQKFDVRVLQCRRPTGLPLRSLSDYITALRMFYRPSLRRTVSDPLAEDWKSTFAIVEPGATVAGSARIHDSVLLAGATVEASAVVVRSVVGGSGAVRKERKIVDQFVNDKPRSR